MATAERIAAILAGKSGPIEYDYKLYRSNIRGHQLDELPALDGAAITLSNYRDHTWEITLPMPETPLLDYFKDFVKAVILLKDAAADEWIRFPMGLYRFFSPEGTDSPLMTTWNLVGKSPEALLLERGAHGQGGYKVAAGAGVLAAVRIILVSQGIPDARINFPTEDKFLATPMFFDPYQDAARCYWLRICNALLTAGGFYALYTDAEGNFTTKDIESLRDREPAVTYGTEPHTEQLITGQISWVYDDEAFANRTVVYAGDPNQGTPVTAVAELHSTPITPPNSWTTILADPDSRVSIEALNGRISQKDPVVLQNIISQNEAFRLARRNLRIASGLNHKLSVPTAPDPRRGPREIYDLDVRRELTGKRLYRGSWWVTGWTLPLNLGQMTHEISRFVRS